jgi:hypothetical protein
MEALAQQLGRTRHTLGSLRSAQADLHNSAQKVAAAERRLAGRRSAPLDVGAVRRELQEATVMMSAAGRRVEQMEAITDLLIEQLHERETELAEMAAARQRAADEHDTEVGARTGSTERAAAPESTSPVDGPARLLTARHVPTCAGGPPERGARLADRPPGGAGGALCGAGGGGRGRQVSRAPSAL